MHAQNRTAPRRAVHAYAYRRSMVLERRARAHWPHWHGRRRRFPQRVRYRTIGGNARRARGSRKPRTGTGTGTGRLSRSLNGARRKTLDTGHRTQDARHRTQDTGHRTQDTEAPASHRIAGQRKAYPAFRHGGRAQAVVEPKPSDVCRRMRTRMWTRGGDRLRENVVPSGHGCRQLSQELMRGVWVWVPRPSVLGRTDGVHPGMAWADDRKRRRERWKRPYPVGVLAPRDLSSLCAGTDPPRAPQSPL